MNSFEFNIAQLRAIAEALGDLLPRITFVGGCTTSLLVDSTALFGVRRTEDVDVIVDVVTYIEYQRFSQELRDKGFVEDVDGPNCRWLFKDNMANIKLDVMPVDERVLGFTNRWYPDAIEYSEEKELSAGLSISVVSAEYFLATKFEAFAGRGMGNYFSHDIEDIVFVLENRAGILREILDTADDLKNYLAGEAEKLLNDEFLNILPGILNNADSATEITNMLKILSQRPWV